MRRFVRVRRLQGLGAPLIPDQFTTAAGAPESFSPGTPDAIIVQVLQQQGQALPADIAAAYAAGQSSAAQPLQKTVTSSLSVAHGVWLWTRSDGTTFYGDANQNPVSYTPPPPPAVAPSGTPVAAPPAQPVVTITTTPAAASQPTATVAPTPGSVQATPAVTPSGTPISTVTGAPLVPTTPAPSTSILPSSVASIFSSLPTWAWLGIGVGALFLFSDGGSSSGRRR